MPTLPGVTGGSTIYPAMYPLTRATAFQTQISMFYNGSEQRWKNRSHRAGFVLEYTQLSATDRAALDTFVTTVLASTGVWTFNRAGPHSLVYPQCSFTEDSFTWTENAEYPGQFDGKIQFQQVSFSSLAASNDDPLPFPALGAPFAGAPGYVTGYPFVKTSAYYTLRNDMDDGNRIAVAMYGSGKTNYPSRAMCSWTLSYTAINDTDLALLESHFISAGGTYATFSFTDPNNSKTYTSVRYSSDMLQIQHIMPGISSLSVKMAEVYDAVKWTA